MGKVSVVRTDQGIRESLIRSLDLIGGLGAYVSRSDSVLLKPNLNGADVYTNKELVGSLIELLLDFGVGRVVIAESTFGTAGTTKSFFEKTGYVELAKRYCIDLINLNESEAVEVPVKNPLVLEKLIIAKEVFEADKLINLPNMKVHYATGVSLALKNLKGLLVRGEKRYFHEVGLDDAIVDLNNTIGADLNIIDSISCMERMGPHWGDIVDLNLLIAGGSRAEVDLVGCQIMGYDIGEVKHLHRYVEINGIEFGGLEVVGERIEDVRHPLKKVSMDSLIPDEFTIHDINACSTCMNAFLISCRVLQGKPNRRVDVYMGSRVEDSSEGLRVTFGNCCTAQFDGDKQIKGCPPYPFALGEVLREILDID